MPSWTSNFFTTSKGTKLHYYRTGGDKPPILLIHGITDDGLCWTFLAKDLETDYDIIMLDLHGHGKSDDPNDGYGFVTISCEVADLINGLKLKNPIVIGHSIGAMTALSVGAYYPDLPRALILEDPPAFWNKKTSKKEMFEIQAGIRMWLHVAKRMTSDELLELAQTETPDWSVLEVAPWVDAKHRFSPKLINFIADLFEDLDDDFLNHVKKISCPCLLFTANNVLGAILNLKEANELGQLIQKFEHVNIPDAGHNIHREQYSLYMQNLQAFLMKL
jgi:pimeloyl-ACP methyl ester carboxylesterase